MSRFRKMFLRDRLNQTAQLAGFGKHPAWDDHIDDIGLTTETLVAVRQILYSEGIASQVSSGAWSRLEESGQALKFDHRFVWSREAKSVIGGIWASRDGKGRTHFPLIVCLQSAVNGWRAIRSFLEPVDQLGILCQVAKDQQKLRDSFGDTQRRLTRIAGWDSDGETRPNDLSKQQACAAINGMIALSQRLGKRSKHGARNLDKSLHFRLPAVSARTQESLEFWAGYLETQFNPRFPYLTIASGGFGPIDIIAGEPKVNDFFCLRATESCLPLTPVSSADKHLADARLEATVYWRSFGLGAIEFSGKGRFGHW
ncbi:MAG: hypothetical protein JO170_29160 [Verrucomicrobia bacterium]|nr:hypothetical protein [Verrucomicrobiota bacterium]